MRWFLNTYAPIALPSGCFLIASDLALDPMLEEQNIHFTATEHQKSDVSTFTAPVSPVILKNQSFSSVYSANALLSRLCFQLGLDWNGFEWKKHASGKPYGLYNGTMVGVGISHCKDMLVCGLHLQGEIGLDVEPCNRAFPKILKNRICHPGEERLLKTHSPLRIWTIKEAVLKMIGTGLRHAMKKINLQQESDYLFRTECASKSIQILSYTFRNHWIAVASALTEIPNPNFSTGGFPDSGKTGASDGKRAKGNFCYPVAEHFYSLQGEGVYSGRAAYFIRLAGCDVGCTWCDVKESWEASEHPLVRTADLTKAAKKSGASFVVITGGEPLLYNLEPLTTALREAGLRIHLETSGTAPLTGKFDFITFSPKRFKKPMDGIYPMADELKIIIRTRKDLEYAVDNAARCRKDAIKLMQPEWNTPKAVPLIIDYIKNNPDWGISLQIHKYLHIP